MEGLSTIALILLLMVLGGVFLVFIVIAVRILTSNNRWGPPAPTQGPHYSHYPKSFEYYRDAPQRAGDGKIPGGHKLLDSARTDDLPRCAKCGAATAFEQERCHKCGESLKKPQT